MKCANEWYKGKNCIDKYYTLTGHKCDYSHCIVFWKRRNGGRIPLRNRKEKQRRKNEMPEL